MKDLGARAFNCGYPAPVLIVATYTKHHEFARMPVSGYKVPDKFARTGLTATKSKNVDAPIIAGSKLVIECKLVEFVRNEGFSCVLA